jgi:hypothetical protein
MPALTPAFKRLVLGLQPTAADSSMRLVAELASVLQLELLGLFLDDSSLRDLARFPFVREFRGPAAGWQPIDIERVSRDLEVAAGNLRRIFERATQELETAARFEVARGSLAEIIAASSRADDIFVIVEPLNPVERATSQFALLSEAAFGSGAAVLLLPSRIRRTSGPIVAIATRPNDPSIQTGAFLALATKEELVIINADHQQGIGDDTRKLAAETGLRVEQIAAARSVFPDPGACAQAFRHLQERLVVMSRGEFDPGVASTIASARQVPVLVIGTGNQAA